MEKLCFDMDKYIEVELVYFSKSSNAVFYRKELNTVFQQ